ncbi:MAG: CDP-glucose 4,6-dehydratase [Pseudomonadota bacterium]
MDCVNEALRQYRDCNVLVTGHTGFKGAWLCVWLSELGARVSGLALAAHTQPNLYGAARVARDVTDIRCDITDYGAVVAAMRAVSPEIVFHLAAQPLVRRSYWEARATFETNFMGTVNVLEAVRHVPSVRAVVHVSTDKCYENKGAHYAYSEDDALGGHDPYSASKAAAELAFSSFGRSFYSSPASTVGTASGRAGNVIGGGDWAEDRVVPDCVRAIMEARTIVIRNPTAVRPWQHVLEALSGYLTLGGELLAGNRAVSGAWNFGPDPTNTKTVADLVDAFTRAWGEGAWKFEQEKTSAHEAAYLTLSNRKARDRLGWWPRWDFSETVRRTAQWYRDFAQGADARELCLADIHAYTQRDHAPWEWHVMHAANADVRRVDV